MTESIPPVTTPESEPAALQAEVDRLRDELNERQSAEKNALAEAVQKRIDSIPEAMRGLIPDYDDPVRLFLWLDRNAELLRPRPAPDLNAGRASAPVTSADPAPGSADHLNEIRKRFRLGGRKW